MIYDGIKFRRSRLYGWRSGNPETDMDLYGDPVSENYIVIVKISDCRLYEKGGRQYYDSALAPQAFPLAYSTNSMGYGKHRTYKDRTTCPVFLVYDAVVYQGTTRSAISVSSLA